MLTGIHASTLFGIFLLPAVVFALVYFPVVTLAIKDLVKSFQEWLMGFGAEFGRAAGKRGRIPARTDRAA